MEIGVVRKLGAGHILWNESGEVKDKNQEKGGAEDAPLGHTVGDGNRWAASTVVCDTGRAVPKVVSQPKAD